MTWQTLLLSLLLQAAQLQLDSGSSSGSISGTVVRDGTNEPIAEATVMLITAVRETGREPVFSVKTDSAGQFSFPDLKPDTYRLGMAAEGYVKLEYGQRVFPGKGTPIHLASGQNLRNLTVSMTPTGTVSGRIRDENGEPIAGAPVQLLSYGYDSSGERVFRPASITQTTDDRGEYRLFFITPGRYYLSAGRTAIGEPVRLRAPNQIAEPLASVFFPGVQDVRQATVVTVRPGEEHGAMDLIIPRQRFYRIRGRIVNPATGGPPPTVVPQIRLRYYNGVNNVAPNLGTTTDGRGTYQDGMFEFGGVPPGSYLLTFAQDWLSGYAAVEVTNADVDGVVLTLSPAVNLEGRIRIAGSNAPGNDALVRVKTLNEGFLGAALSAVTTPRADGTFIVNSLAQGEYRVIVSDTPPDTYVREARFGITDALREPIRVDPSEAKVLEIVVSPGAATISGAVRDASQGFVAGAHVVVVPDRFRERTDLFRDAVADQNGRFNISGIAPGQYRVLAWDAIEPFGWFDPEALKRAELGSRVVTLSEASTENVDVRVTANESR